MRALANIFAVLAVAAFSVAALAGTWLGYRVVIDVVVPEWNYGNQWPAILSLLIFGFFSSGALAGVSSFFFDEAGKQ